RREGGVRLYAPQMAHQRPVPVDPEAAFDALIDVAVAKYAPLPGVTLNRLINWLGTAAVPQWKNECRLAQVRFRAKLGSAKVAGCDWFWPTGENPGSRRFASDDVLDEELRLLAPFDPLVW